MYTNNRRLFSSRSYILLSTYLSIPKTNRVGAIDSIVDVTGTILALHHLGVDTVSCSRIPMGEGSVWTDHGQLPVPAFATMRLLLGMKTCKGPGDISGVVTGELVTPTAAALLRVLTGVAEVERKRKEGIYVDDSNVRVGRPPNFTPRAIGIGAGTKDFVKHPNVIRVFLGSDVSFGQELKKQNRDEGVELVPKGSVQGVERSADEDIKSLPILDEVIPVTSALTNDVHQNTTTTPTSKWNIDKLTLLEANIDDITAEALSFVVDLLLKNGAIDAWVKPIVMKKGRSAHTLCCLMHNDDDDDKMGDNGGGMSVSGRLLELIFRHTTTLGIRIRKDIERATLNRKMMSVDTEYGCVRVKVAMLGEEVVTMKAEFDDCKLISEKLGVSLQNIADAATRKAKDNLNVLV